jgi:hypothetical protein
MLKGFFSRKDLTSAFLALEYDVSPNWGLESRVPRILRDRRLSRLATQSRDRGFNDAGRQSALEGCFIFLLSCLGRNPKPD